MIFKILLLVVFGVFFLATNGANWVYADKISVIPVGDAVQLGCHETELGCFTLNQFNAKVGDEVIFHNPHDEFHY
jgi:hypothetical protein